LQDKARDDEHQEAEQEAYATGQREQRRDDRGDQVDDKGDREEVLGERLVHPPCFVKNARQWVHGRDGTARI